MGILDTLFGLGVDRKSTDNRPCNEVGHSWGDWKRDPFSIKGDDAKYQSNDKLAVYFVVRRRCEKCDRGEMKRKYVGAVALEDEELVVE